MTQKAFIQSAGAMVFAVPPGFVARVSAQPQGLTLGQIGSFTVASRLSLHGPNGLSVSSSRVIFVGARGGALTVSRSLCPHHPATRPFHWICSTESTSVRVPTATASCIVIGAWLARGAALPMVRGERFVGLYGSHVLLRSAAWPVVSDQGCADADGSRSPRCRLVWPSKCRTSSLVNAQNRNGCDLRNLVRSGNVRPSFDKRSSSI